MIRYKNLHEKKIEDIEKETLSFFREKISISDTGIQKFIEKLDINYNEFHMILYNLFHSVLKGDIYENRKDKK